jgi:hypothetical protein
MRGGQGRWGKEGAVSSLVGMSQIRNNLGRWGVAGFYTSRVPRLWIPSPESVSIGNNAHHLHVRGGHGRLRVMAAEYYHEWIGNNLPTNVETYWWHCLKEYCARALF